jgi:hypothetical protein
LAQLFSLLAYYYQVSVFEEVQNSDATVDTTTNFARKACSNLRDAITSTTIDLLTKTVAVAALENGQTEATQAMMVKKILHDSKAPTIDGNPEAHDVSKMPTPSIATGFSYAGILELIADPIEDLSKPIAAISAFDEKADEEKIEGKGNEANTPSLGSAWLTDLSECQ